MATEKRLIDANELWHKTFVCEEPGDFRKAIENAPTVYAVEVVHGRWEQRKIIDWVCTKTCFRCTECKTHWDADTNYCPNCGAKMDGDGNG